MPTRLKLSSGIGPIYFGDSGPTLLDRRAKVTLRDVRLAGRAAKGACAESCGWLAILAAVDAAELAGELRAASPSDAGAECAGALVWWHRAATAGERRPDAIDELKSAWLLRVDEVCGDEAFRRECLADASTAMSAIGVPVAAAAAITRPSSTLVRHPAVNADAMMSKQAIVAYLRDDGGWCHVVGVSTPCGIEYRRAAAILESLAERGIVDARMETIEEKGARTGNGMGKLRKLYRIR